MTADQPKTTFDAVAHFYLRGGAVVDVPCDELYYETRGGELTKYRITGMSAANGAQLVDYIRPDAIDAITRTKWQPPTDTEPKDTP